MDTTHKSQPEADERQRLFARWFERLTTRAKKAVLRKQERRRERDVARKAFKDAATSGYCCPKCFTWHPTPEARKACRLSHNPRAA